MATTKAGSFLSPKAYDKWKFVAQIVLPALGTMCFSLMSLWNIPHATEVVGTITAVDLFLGVLLGFSSQQFYKSGANFDGEVVESDDKVSFQFNKPPDEILQDEPGKHSMEFRIKRQNEGDI